MCKIVSANTVVYFLPRVEIENFLLNCRNSGNIVLNLQRNTRQINLFQLDSVD